MESLRGLLDPSGRSKPAIRNTSGGSGSPSPSLYQQTSSASSYLSEVVVKIVVLGGTGVGKSTAIQRFCSEVKGSRPGKTSVGRSDPTIGVNVVSCHLGVRGSQTVYVHFWEVPFQEIEAAAGGSATSANQLHAAFSCAHGVIVAYDTSSAVSFLSVDSCLDAVAAGDAAGITDAEIADYCTTAGYSHWWSCSVKDDAPISVPNAIADVISSAITIFRLIPVDPPPQPAGIVTSSSTSQPSRPLKPARRADGSASIPSFSEWLDSVGLACGSAESFVVTAKVNDDRSVSRSSRHRVVHTPSCKAAMWSSSEDSEFVGKVKEDAVKKVSAIASSLLGQPGLGLLPRFTVHTTAPPSHSPSLPPSVICSTICDALHPLKRRQSESVALREEVRVSISNQDGETFLVGAGFPQPLLTPLGDIASYDDDEVTSADGEGAQLEYRYKIGVSLLTDWFVAFCESCEEQFPVATSDLNSAYFSRVMELWSHFKQSSLAKLREFSRAKPKSMEAVANLEVFRRSMIPECREWTKTLNVVSKLR